MQTPENPPLGLGFGQLESAHFSSVHCAQLAQAAEHKVVKMPVGADLLWGGS